VFPGDSLEPIDPDLAAAEGQPKLVAHIKRERKPALAAAKRRAMIAEHGLLKCERCNLIPSTELGPYGDSVIEVHHAVTKVSEMLAGHITRLADLMCPCANCHRIVHRELAN
jgi:predicted HNH restriction endonuclease